MSIGRPTHVTRGGAATSPIVKIDQKARAAVPNWDAAPIAARSKAVFDAFVEVFRENRWKYAAGSIPGVQTNALLLGQQTMADIQAMLPSGFSASLDCGRIRNLLAVTFTSLLGVKVEDSRIAGHFVTKKMGTPPGGVTGEFRSIDRNIYGNVRTTRTAYQVEQRCLFEDHYAIRVLETGLIYDACLVSIYPSIQLVVETLLQKAPGSNDILVPRPPAPGSAGVRYQVLRNEQPYGFGAGYMKL